ncbi:DUF3429 domain-containing protein [Mangrovicoccus sp. HB161399]|uniref:DUF3429 domain-containing protein n=1 Tax=Mangrovicoccus sp. HB161399 TaxID=2720392 RepID=UPI001554A07F|nr:DUF3429 domain-containing protein [Mangrovicoccus sp. HB161399]
MKDTYGIRNGHIPPPALWLGLAGLAPFFWGLATGISPALFDFGLATLGPRFVGLHLQVAYGTIILAFMSGALWGFASRSDGPRRNAGLALSTLPALWAFLFVGGGAEHATVVLIAGFVGLLGLDMLFERYGLTPAWWMKLRNLLTLLAVACMTAGLLA